MSEKVSILAVLVLYRQSMEQSVTWQALVSQVNRELCALVSFSLLVCDNGPLARTQSATALPDWVEYAGVEENHGLAWAYNLGLKQANEVGAGWLLTLDQDTALPSDFLLRMAAVAGEREKMPTVPGQPVVAIVPQLVCEDGRVLSPSVVKLASERVMKRGFQGSVDGEVRAYNSGALIRVDALNQIGGYDRRFWLDYLDHVLFHALHAAGGCVWIQGNVQLLHRLSLHNDRESLSEQRFRNFSGAESAFRDVYASPVEGLIFTGRLFLRLMNQKRRGDPEHFLRATWTVLKARLLMRRKKRIARWEVDVDSMAVAPRLTMEVRGRSAGASAVTPS